MVDALDTVAANCETVDRAGGGSGEPRGRGTRGSDRAGHEPWTTAHRPAQGPAGATDGLRARDVIRLKLKVGARVVGSGRATVRPDGTAKARLRFTRAARRSLSRRRSVRLVVTAGPVATTISVKR